MIKLMDKLGAIFNRKSTSVLLDVTESIDNALNGMASDIDLWKLQYNILTASGEWLEEWGSWFGVYRKLDEPDEEYQQRILAALARITSTIPAIKRCVLDYLESKYGYQKYTEDDIHVIEPFNYLKRFSQEGSFSGVHKYQDGVFWRHHVLEVIIPEPVTEELTNLIKIAKAAGIMVYFRYNTYPTSESAQVDMTSPEPRDYMYTLLSELDITAMTTGNTFSAFVPALSRTRSGNKTIWGPNTSILYEIPKVVHNDFSSGDSYIKAYDMYYIATDKGLRIQVSGGGNLAIGTVTIV